jgi:DNA ligase-1
MQLDAVATISRALSVLPGRSAKVARLAELLRDTEPAELPIVVSWLSGELTQRQIGVGWAALRGLPAPAAEPSLAVSRVQACFSEIGATSGTGSQGRRRALLESLFADATESEQKFLVRLLTGDLRQGALVGLMTDAVARAAGIPLAEVRRAAMLSGNLAELAAIALTGGAAALAEIQLRVGRAVGPMLAQTAESTGDALSRLGGTAAFEWKLDGIRIQVHRAGAAVSIFTRSLDDVTARLPEVAEAVSALRAGDLVLDGEVIALAQSGRPEPFQVTASRLGTRGRTGTASLPPPQAFFFDVLHVDGVDVLDEPAAERAGILAALLPAAAQVPRLVTSQPALAEAFLHDALEHGHEGVVAKSLTAPYEAGRRGAGWLKVKPVHTLDLVVLAVEWGSGRRQGSLSNIHLGARDDAGGGFVMLGKTFKGMTDAMLRWQTERFLSLAAEPLKDLTGQQVVPLRPEQVVEIAFDGVQTSSRYPGGLALRFARVLRYRDDKTADQADTLATVRALRDR